jgi:hypothetical protein
MKIFLRIVLLQIAFAAILGGAIFMGKRADERCRPPEPPPLKDCHPYPEAGRGAMICTWQSTGTVIPWAPSRCETR